MNDAQSTVLVTGAAGFLGQHVVRAFLDESRPVIGVDLAGEPTPQANYRFERLSLPSPAFDELLRGGRVGTLVHCAGRASVEESLRTPKADFEASALLTLEVLEALRLHSPHTRLLLLSSAAVYGDPLRLPIDEEAPVRPLSPYGFHKHQCELLCREYATVFGLKTLSFRIFSAYGAGLKRQVVWDIVRKACREPELVLRGSGEESRDFIHALDVARACVIAEGRAEMKGECYNLASGQETSIRELAERILDALGLHRPLVFDRQSLAGVPKRWQADIARLQSLGFRPSVALEQGLRETAEWARQELGGA